MSTRNKGFLFCIKRAYRRSPFFLLIFVVIIFLIILPNIIFQKDKSIENISYQKFKPIKYCFCEKNTLDKIDTILIISPDTTRFFLATDWQWRIEYLSEIVMQHLASYVQVHMVHSSDKLQIRLGFIAIYIALIIPFLRLKRKNRSLVLIVSIIFFLGFYGYEIHSNELDSRLDFKRKCINNTLVFLSNIKPENSTWYDIKLDEMNQHIEDARINRKCRKICYFFRPDLSQIAYYFIPFTVVLSLFLFSGKPKKN